jgi:hypothetical protein
MALATNLNQPLLRQTQPRKGSCNSDNCGMRGIRDNKPSTSTKMKSIIKSAASAAIAISAAAMLSPVAFAGQIGSGSSNTFGHEEYQGRNWSHGNSQAQETVSGVSRSSSSKAEFITPEGQMPGRIQALPTSSSSESNCFLVYRGGFCPLFLQKY